MVGLSEERRAELYQIAIDDNKTLDERWEATRQLRENKPFNPLLGELDSFINANQNLIHSVIQQCRYKTKSKVEYEDLFQEGLIGIVTAYSKYDGRAAFSTFSFYHIRNEIMRYIRDKGQVFRIPVHVYEVAGKILRNKWTEKTPEFISEQLDCTVNTANYALGHISLKSNRSIHEVIVSDDGEKELGDVLGYQADYSSAIVNDFVNRLSEKQQMVLHLASQGLSQQEIGQRLGFKQAQAWRHMQSIREAAREFFGNGVSA